MERSVNSIMSQDCTDFELILVGNEVVTVLTSFVKHLLQFCN